MREIKFRAFVSKESRFNSIVGMIKGEHIKTMLNPKFTKIYGEHCWDETGLILMQFTGLKDKNGKEIYESDICTERNNNCKISFVNGAFIPEWVNRGYSNYSLNYHCSKLEVIGNIYENPELLS